MAKKLSYSQYLRQEMTGLIDQLDVSDVHRQSLKQRWLDQTIWADKKADQCRRWHYRLRLTTILGGVILPALVGINFQVGRSNTLFRVWFPYLTFGLSQIIAVSAALEEFCRFGDRWRQYRQMAEDLKAEGWQYLQLSATYKATTHEAAFPTFANRVESIIKNDVQAYLSELVRQQEKQEQECAKALETAQSTSRDRTLFAYADPNLPPARAYGAMPGGMPPQPGYPAMNPYPAGAGYPVANSYAGGGYPPVPPTMPPTIPPASPPMSGYPTSIAPSPVPTYPYPSAPASPAAASTTGTTTMAPPVAPLTSPTPAAANLNAAIVAAASSLRGMSTADGPDGGNNACAWTLNKVLQKAGIPPLGDNPNYVPSVHDALKEGRGQLVSREQAKAGDLVIAANEAHVGVSLEDGCRTVLSNSSSRACFVWESDADFDGYYGGSSTIYRLLR